MIDLLLAVSVAGAILIGAAIMVAALFVSIAIILRSMQFAARVWTGEK
ncbi:MAG: hypothetical protein K2X34_01130 [Hyphomonadaceae bacterium]|nr:hypothetical protein [Hyphomonadaceae bacterium]